MIVQLPGGWLLDRFGSKKVYFCSLAFWSVFTAAVAYVGLFPVRLVFPLLFSFLLMLGVAEGPSFPANSRIVAAWFPSGERGLASAIFNSAQYFAQVVFAPIMGIVVTTLGWKQIFNIMGGIGILFALVILKVLHAQEPPCRGPGELDYIEKGGALVNLDQGGARPAKGRTLEHVKQLLASRMMLGVYFGQYCITCLTWFFLTWFPIYLVRGGACPSSKWVSWPCFPALAGSLGGILGGFISDTFVKKGFSLTVGAQGPHRRRHAPLHHHRRLQLHQRELDRGDVPDRRVLRQGHRALGWAVVSDTAAKEIAGLSGGLFNMFGNSAGIITPIAIAWILQKTNSFNGALVFVGLHALGAIFCYLVIVPRIQRFELKHG